MSDRTPTTFLPGRPNQADRRSFANPRTFADVQSLVQIFDDPRTRAPILHAQSCQYLVSVLDRQYDLSLERGYPICLALATLDTGSPENMPLSPVAILNTVAKIWRSKLRPTDLLFQYSDRLIAMVLLESDEDGGASVAERLKRSLDRRLYFGKTALSVRPYFAVSDSTVGFGSAGRSLLTTAELALNRAANHNYDVAVASRTVGLQTVGVSEKAQEIANAITGMFK